MYHRTCEHPSNIVYKYLTYTYTSCYNISLPLVEHKFSPPSRHEPEPYIRNTAANGDYEATAETPTAATATIAVWMSQISTEWKECSFMTLSTIHWVPVQDKGSKILCGKLGAVKITPSDCLHQEYLTINLGSTSDWQQLKLPLVRLFGRWRGRCWPGGAARGRDCRGRSSGIGFTICNSFHFIYCIVLRVIYSLSEKTEGRGAAETFLFLWKRVNHSKWYIICS